MTDRDTKQFKFDPKMYGLPDSAILGDNGKPQEGTLRQSLHLTRNQGNKIKKDFKSIRLNTQFVAPRLVFINRMADPQFRASLILITVTEILKENTRKTSGNIKSNIKYFTVNNWELLTLKKYAPDLWDYIPPGEDIERAMEKAGEQASKPIAHASIIAKKISERAVKEIEDWEKLPEIKQAQLADVYFAIGFFLDFDILNNAIFTHPELLKYYSLIINNEYNRDIAAKLEEGAPPDIVNEEAQIEYSIPEDYYQAIETLVAEAKAGPRDPLIAQALLKKVEELNDWFEKSPQLAPLPECITQLLNTLYTLGREAGLDGFLDDDSNTRNFKSCWYLYFCSERAKQVREDVLVERLVAGEETINRLSKMIEALKQEVKLLSSNVAELVQQEPENRSARRQHEEDLATFDTRRQERKNRLYEIEDEAILTLVPPGSNSEELESVEELDMPDEDAFSESMQIALQRVYSYMESGFIATESKEPAEFKEEELAEFELEDDEIYDEEDWSLESRPTQYDLLGKLDLPQEYQASEMKTEDVTVAISVELDQFEIETDQIDETITAINVDQTAAYLPNEETASDTSTEKNSTRVQLIDDAHEETQGLQATCIAQLNHQGYIEGHLINQAIMGLLSNDRIETAIGLAWLVSDRQFSKDTLPTDLLEGAYFGSQNWEFGRALNKSQEILTVFSPATIELWGELFSAGKSVPYLIFTACFQPAIFGGNYSNAPFLLNSIKHIFEGPTRRLIEETINLANHNKMVNLGNLRLGDEKVGQEKTINFSHQVGAWAQKIRNTKKGYAPILKAQSYCLEKGLFGDVFKIIRNNNGARLDTIKQFVSKYQEREATDQLLDESIDASRQEFYSSSILSHGRYRFYHKVGELIEIAQGWMGQFGEQDSEVENYCRKFSTLLPQAINQFRSIIDEECKPLDRRAGAKVVVTCLENLRRVVDGNETPVWKYERTKVWMHYPEHIIRLYGVTNDPAAQLNWYLSQVETPFLYNDVLDLAMDKDDIALGYLMYMFLRDGGDDRKRIEADLKDRFAQKRTHLRRGCKKLESQIDNAVLSLLIKPDRAEQLIAELEELQEAISVLNPYYPTQDIEDQLKTVHEEITRKTANKLKVLEETYRSELEQIYASVSGDPVPDEWVCTMESAISDANLPVIDEMLDELQTARLEGQPIRFSQITQATILHDFLSSEEVIFHGIKDKSNCKDIWQDISLSKEFCYGLDFSQYKSAIKHVIESFCSWNSRRPPHEIDPELYTKVATVLEFIGLHLVDKAFKRSQKSTFHYRLGEGFAVFYIKVKAAETRQPFPIFGDSGSNFSLPVIIAFNEWSPEQLEAYIQNIGLMGAKPIFISGVPLSIVQRNQFANYFKCSKSMLLHIDLTMALFLGSLPNNAAENSAIRNFLWLTLPWTYFNPYVGGDTTFPPPNEMRYGRATEINRLLEMNNGHAIVYGGRQLGKSTIVQEVRNNFHKPNLKQLAFYHLLDKNMDRMGINRDHWDRARKMVWELIYGDLRKSGLIERDDVKLTPNQMSQEVETALFANKDHKVIVIFDEIDPILNVDNAHDFGIFRGLRELVSKPGIQGRFKLIIAGLENVKRFENSPNYPLQQLGASLQVSIMSTQDALHLINEPLFAAGYSFENAQVANRILAITNRHPGLIQVFCHELIASLATSKRNLVGGQIITDEDITNVNQKQEVIDLIRTRFDMTLNLDHRYSIIIYGLLNEKKGTRPIAAKEAHEIASEWLPDEFQKLGVKQFEAFLTELCGLGVLKAIKEGQLNQYALRNTNILKLIGDDEDEINYKLQMALKQQQSSPLDRHAFWPDKMEVCPITFRDEKELLGSESGVDEDSFFKQEGSWKYTATIIVGSNALGSDELASTLPRLYEVERLEHANLKHAFGYELFERYDADFSNSPEKFQNILRGMLETKSKGVPVMMIVNVTGNNPIAHFLGMLDAAHSLNNITMDKKYPVRVVFSLSPKAYWQWLLHPDLTDGREQLQPFIKLAHWNNSGIEHLLGKLGMVNTPSDVAKLMDHSEGWYVSLNILCKIKENSSGINELSDVSGEYVPMYQIKSKEAKKFIKASGIKDVPWAESLIRAINKDWSGPEVSLEEIQLSAQEIDAFQNKLGEINPAIHWLTGLNILRRVRNNESTEPHYRVSSSIIHALDVIDA